MLKCGGCGYKRGYHIDDGFINEHNDKFIRIEGTFTVSKFGSLSNIEEVELYICPKCKTVIAYNDFI